MDGTDETKINGDNCDEMSETEKTRLINENSGLRFPPEIREKVWTDREIAAAESPSHLMDDFPYGFRFPEQIELNAQGIYETMYETLPEMDLILENECIL